MLLVIFEMIPKFLTSRKAVLLYGGWILHEQDMKSIIGHFSNDVVDHTLSYAVSSQINPATSAEAGPAGWLPRPVEQVRFFSLTEVSGGVVVLGEAAAPHPYKTRRV